MSIAGKPLPHESARGHVTGEALYTDDLLGRFPHLLHAWPVTAPHAHALVKRLDATPALDEPRVVATLTAADAPGNADSGPRGMTSPSSLSKSCSTGSLWRGCWARRSRLRSGAPRVFASNTSRCRPS